MCVFQMEILGLQQEQQLSLCVKKKNCLVLEENKALLDGCLDATIHNHILQRVLSIPYQPFHFQKFEINAIKKKLILDLSILNACSHQNFY